MKKFKKFIDLREGEDGAVTTLYEVLDTHAGYNLVMSGDYHHDKIDDKIEGFFNALDYLDVSYDISEIKLEENEEEEEEEEA